MIKVLSEGMYAEHGTESVILGVSKTVLQPETTELHGGAIKIIKIPEWFSLGSMPVPEFRPFVREYKKALKSADIIHYHFPWPIGDLVDRLFNRKRKKPTLVTYQSDIVKQRYMMVVYRPLMNLFLRSVDVIVASTDNYLKTSKVLQKYRQKVKIIPNGLEKIDSSDEILALSESYKTKYSRGYFLFVGAPRYYKGLAYLIKAAQGADFDVVIAGQGVELQYYIETAHDEGIDTMQYLGRVSDKEKAALIHGCRGLVLPSIERSEAYGLVLVEALSAGKPLISTELGTGTSFINQHKVTGLVVEAKNVQALQEAMIALNDNEHYDAYSKEARARYVELFSDKAMVDAYYNLYASLLA